MHSRDKVGEAPEHAGADNTPKAAEAVGLTSIDPEEQNRVKKLGEPRYDTHGPDLSRVVHHVHVALRRPVELHDTLDTVPAATTSRA